METRPTTIQNRIEYFERNYSVLVDVNLIGDKAFTLAGAGIRHCRFCQRKDGLVTFQDEAHAFPELIGNRILLTEYECDQCNAHFSKYLENHLANYLGPARTFARTRGKSGVPSYKTSDDLSRIDVKAGTMIVSTVADQPIFVEDEKRKLVTFYTTKSTYIPVAVYKTVVKTALSILPETDMEPFRSTASWLLSEDHSKSFVRPCPMHFSFTNGYKPYPFIKAIVFKVRDSAYPVPYMQFFLAFDNFTFQVTIPTERDRHLEGKVVAIEAFPSIHEITDTENETKHAFADMSSSVPVRGSKVEVQMSYERKEPSSGRDSA